MGSRIQNTHLYKWHSYPFDLIAPVTIIWRPLPLDDTSQSSLSDAEGAGVANESKTSKGKENIASSSSPKTKTAPSIKRTLWVRVHPSAWVEVWDTLKEACSHTLEEFRKEQEGNAEQSSDVPEESIELIDLRSRVNCFEIMGPKSSQVLKGVLSVIDREERKPFHEVCLASSTMLYV